MEYLAKIWDFILNVLQEYRTYIFVIVSPSFHPVSRWLSVYLQCGIPGFDPWIGKIPVEGNGNPLQYSCLENSMDGGAWWATVRGITKSQTWLSDFTFFHFLLSEGRPWIPFSFYFAWLANKTIYFTPLWLCNNWWVQQQIID